MKIMLDLMEKNAHLFEPGGKFEKLYPLFEAQDTFMFTPADVTTGKTHVRDAIDLKRVMITVVIALLPCLLWAIYNVGYNYNYVNQTGQAGNFTSNMLWGSRFVLPIVMVSYIVGGVFEVLFCILRKHEINEGFLVTGMLFPLTLPPTIPLWQVGLGIAFGVVIGKEIFGGTGFNILNPALTARAFLFFAYPVQISGEVWTVLKEGATPVAGWTGATPLAVAASAGKGGFEVVQAAWSEWGYSIGTMGWGLEGGSLGETALIPILLGAAILILTGIGSWRIMVGCVIGLIVAATLLNWTGNEFIAFTEVPWSYHLVMGGFLFGTVFMATDPVSAAATNRGKWIYGFLIGALTVLIRVTNPAYPEGVMLSILFMNVMAPLIDYYVVRGHINKRNSHIRKFSHAKG